MYLRPHDIPMISSEYMFESSNFKLLLNDVLIMNGPTIHVSPRPHPQVLIGNLVSNMTWCFTPCKSGHNPWILTYDSYDFYDPWIFVSWNCWKLLETGRGQAADVVVLGIVQTWWGRYKAPGEAGAFRRCGRWPWPPLWTPSQGQVNVRFGFLREWAQLQWWFPQLGVPVIIHF